MSVQVKASDFTKGKEVSFVYHEKLRLGTVEEVGTNHVCLEVVGDPDPAIKYKSFNFHKITELNNLQIVE